MAWSSNFLLASCGSLTSRISSTACWSSHTSQSCLVSALGADWAVTYAIARDDEELVLVIKGGLGGVWRADDKFLHRCVAQ